MDSAVLNHLVQQRHYDYADLYFAVVFQSVSDFTFQPQSGELRPLEQKKVVVRFVPKEVKTVQRTFVMEVEDGNTV